jgi:hypothetical protein
MSSTGTLSPGQWYRVTDYKSVNFLNGWGTARENPTPTDPNFNPREIYTGEVEPLLVQAITPYEVSPIGYSETHPGDIIQYAPYTNKIGLPVDIANGNTLPDSTIVSGFDLQWDGANVYFNMPQGYPALLGHFFYPYAEFDGGNYSQDGVYEPLTPGIAYCQYPYTSDDPDYSYPKAMTRIKVEGNGYKIILLDLTETDYNNYDQDTLYVQTIYALGDAYGYITRRQDTQKVIDVPFDFRGIRYRRFEVDLSPINSSLGTNYYGIGDNYLGQGTTGNFKDFKVFGNDGYDLYNIKWVDLGGPDAWWYNGYSENNVFISNAYNLSIGTFFNDNTFVNSNVFDSRIANFFSENVISSYFANNVIGNEFRSNKIDSFYNNTIGYNFSNNIISNYCVGNTISNDFSNNTIGNNFSNNTIGNSFSGCIIGANCTNNTISNNLGGFNFTAATHIYGSYDTNLFLRSNGSPQLSYVDGTNTLQYAAINA